LAVRSTISSRSSLHRSRWAAVSAVILVALTVLAGPAAAATSSQVWKAGPPICPFDPDYPGDGITRLGAAFFPATGKIYLLGGRNSGSAIDAVPSIWSLDPLTGACADTGVDLPTPISNCSVIPVYDGVDDLLCTFGGTKADGNLTLDVQCYNPLANSVAVRSTLPAEYDGYLPGGQAVVGNKVYIFGGFRATATPYALARTDVWDPVAGTYTRLGDLSVARAYIASAVVDGMVYAVGGMTFDGVGLVANGTVERLDPAVGTWDDAGVADLPGPRGEARAFGFNSSSVVGPAGSIVLAGGAGADWPDPDAVVQIYRVAADAWEGGFPDLINPRRDHAGVYVSAISANPEDGLPGLWVLGGRQLTEWPPYAPVEFYPFGLLPALFPLVIGGP
jgi:hypothetical protein